MRSDIKKEAVQRAGVRRKADYQLRRCHGAPACRQDREQLLPQDFIPFLAGPWEVAR